MRDPFQVAELARRLANIARFGRVVSVDPAAATARVAYDSDEAGADVLTGALPWLPAHAGDTRSWRAPSVGEQVLLLAPSGDLAQAVALPAAYSDARPAPSDDADAHLVVHGDGARISYNARTHHLDATLPAGATAGLVADGGVSITGNVAIAGSLTATMDVSDMNGSMQEMRDTHNSHDHPAGHPPGNTSVPNQQMD